MKVWITKFVLTRGIIEAEGKLCGPNCIFVNLYNGRLCEYFKEGEWFDTEEKALKKAKEMQQKTLYEIS